MVYQVDAQKASYQVINLIHFLHADTNTRQSKLVIKTVLVALTL